jgi:hypothetical protein
MASPPLKYYSPGTYYNLLTPGGFVKFLTHFCLLIACGLAFCGPANAQNLITNGDFESGLGGWTAWSASSAFWSGSWLQSNDCDIWVPTNGCPFAGTISHAQKKGGDTPNAHGGLFQTITVTPGETYTVFGQWSGGVTGGSNPSNGTWWEIAVYDGVPTEAEIDAGLGAQDILIAKKEANGLAFREVYQFQWEPFSGQFTPASSSVTLVLKTGSYNTIDAAAYHDDIVISQVLPEMVPATSPTLLAALATLLSLAAWMAQSRRRRV